MSPENKPYTGRAKENVETDLVSYAPLLGGMFETAGTMRININVGVRQLRSGQKTYTNTDPMMRYKDNREFKVLRFKNLLGGSFRRANPYNSYIWEVHSNTAVELASSMEPFAPSRNEMINAFINWQNEEDNDEKLAIALSVKGQPVMYQSEDVYEELINNPAFLAGVFEARGYFTVGRNEKSVLVINTLNSALRNVIQRRFGGSITNKRSGSVSWQLYEGSQIEKIIALISPHLITPLGEFAQRAT